MPGDAIFSACIEERSCPTTSITVLRTSMRLDRLSAIADTHLCPWLLQPWK